MPLARHVAALLEALRREDFDALPPAERERFAHLCRRCADLARRRSEEPKAGLLLDLQSGRSAN
jgi:hypothetical protein